MEEHFKAQKIPFPTFIQLYCPFETLSIVKQEKGQLCY
jgi:hypothetical protein